MAGTTDFGPVYGGGQLPPQVDWKKFMLDDPTSRGTGFDVAKFARAMTLLQFSGLANQLKSGINQETKYGNAIPEAINKSYAGLMSELAAAKGKTDQVQGANQAANAGLANSLGSIIGGPEGSGAGQAFGANAQTLNNQNAALGALMQQQNSDNSNHYQFQKGGQQAAMQAASQGRLSGLQQQQTQARTDSSNAYVKNMMDLMQMKQQGQGNAINIAGNLQNQNLAQALGADQLAMSGLQRTQMADQIASNRTNQYWNDLSNAQNYAQGQQALKQLKDANSGKPLVWHKMNLDQQDAAMQNATRGIWKLDPATGGPVIGTDGSPVLKNGLNATVDQVLKYFKGTIKITPGLRHYVQNWIQTYNGPTGTVPYSNNDPTAGLFGPYSAPTALTP